MAGYSMTWACLGPTKQNPLELGNHNLNEESMNNSLTPPCDQVPRLPPDLERTIFELAALSRTNPILSLMLVARRVKHWYGRNFPEER
jgi:hypothetical protein